MTIMQYFFIFIGTMGVIGFVCGFIGWSMSQLSNYVAKPAIHLKFDMQKVRDGLNIVMIQGQKVLDALNHQSDPIYNPAEHWRDDYTVIEPGESFCLTCGGSGCQGWDPVYPCDDCLGYGWIDYKRDPPECRHCGGLGYFPAHTYCLPENAEPAYSCNECDGWGYLWEFEPPPEPEEIDPELMGVPL